MRTRKITPCLLAVLFAFAAISDCSQVEEPPDALEDGEDESFFPVRRVKRDTWNYGSYGECQMLIAIDEPLFAHLKR